jgi:hypothetical protein
MPMFKSRSAGLFLSFLMCGTPLCSELNDSQKLARDIFKELIEINTTHSVGNTTTAAQVMATRLRNAGFGVSGVFFDVEDNRAHGSDERVRIEDFVTREPSSSTASQSASVLRLEPSARPDLLSCYQTPCFPF